MHVLCVNYLYDHEVVVPQDIVTRCVTLRECAQALVGQGARVTVLQRFHYDAELEHAGVRYVFRADHCQPTLQRGWQVPLRFHRVARDLGPTIVHANGLPFFVPLWGMRTALRPSSALVVQDHASRPSRRWWRLQRRCLRDLDGFLFTTRAQAEPWHARGVIRPDQPVYDVLEGSTLLRWGDRAAARARTGLTGSPIVLWVGRLIDLKDPLVVLRGWASVVKALPHARLYMAYSDATLLDAVRAATQADPSVTLLGRRPHAEMEDLYNSADYFVLGSHREGSGYALLEALACGVVPVVTDIPSFRMITDDGRLGALWPVGDAEGMAAALMRAHERSTPARSQAIAAHFEQRLSYRSIGRALMETYDDVLKRRSSSSSNGS